jgi:UDPglucose 6-dehydrogenase
MSICIVSVLVGVVLAGVFASFRHTVYGLDIGAEKANLLSQGKVPFFEPNLEELVNYGLRQRHLHFTTQYDSAIPQSDIIMITVGTPALADGTADLTLVMAVAEAFAPYLKEKTVVAIKSTVPPGTNQKVRDVIANRTAVEFAVVSIPEFIREGSAVDDTVNGERVVFGAKEEWAVDRLLALYKPIGGERVVTSPESAQIAKYASSVYLALRITFINQIADLCEKTGASISEVLDIIGTDNRIGDQYWYPGLGYGGSRFPMEVKELIAISQNLIDKNNFLTAMDDYNESRIVKKMDEYEVLVDGFKGKMIAVLGLSYKPNTINMKMAPSLKVIPYLKDKKAVVKAYDPRANDEAKKIWPGIFYGNTIEETVHEAEVILLLVEWNEFTNMDLNMIADRSHKGAWIIDTRNMLNQKKVESYGFKYKGIGNL